MRFLRIAGLLLGCAVCLWLGLQPEGLPMTAQRVEHVLGVFGVVLGGSLLIGMAAAVVGRHRQWSPRDCGMVGAPLTLVGLLGVASELAVKPNHWFVALICCSWVSGVVCRKMLYPGLGWIQESPDDPALTLR